MAYHTTINGNELLLNWMSLENTQVKRTYSSTNDHILYDMYVCIYIWIHENICEYMSIYEHIDIDVDMKCSGRSSLQWQKIGKWVLPGQGGGEEERKKVGWFWELPKTHLGDGFATVNSLETPRRFSLHAGYSSVKLPYFALLSFSQSSSHSFSSFPTETSVPSSEFVVTHLRIRTGVFRGWRHSSVICLKFTSVLRGGTGSDTQMLQAPGAGDGSTHGDITVSFKCLKTLIFFIVKY